MIVARWVLLWAFAVLALAVIYRFAPAREHARWRWVTWGSVVAATLWLAGSVLFAFYVRTICRLCPDALATLGGVVVLLMWFYLSSFFVVLGALVNGEMERQTRRDTTEGEEAPLGQRGAYVADTVGPSARGNSQGQEWFVRGVTLLIQHARFWDRQVSFPS